MPKITTKLGTAVFVVSWLLIVYLTSGESACLQTDTYERGDLILSSIVGAGMLVPACLLGAVVSAVFGADGSE